MRRETGSLAVGAELTEERNVVLDCVGSEDSLADALAMVRPRGTVVLVGMPGSVKIDLTTLWHRETKLVGVYAYGTETMANGAERRTFDLAFDLARDARLERLVSATYPLSVRLLRDPARRYCRPARQREYCVRHAQGTREESLMPRPGFVLDVDRSTPPLLFHHGEGLRLHKLPAGTPAIYPPEPLDGVDDVDGAIRDACSTRSTPSRSRIAPPRHEADDRGSMTSPFRCRR